MAPMTYLLHRRQSLDLPHRPDFNSSDPRSGNPAGDVDGFIEILGVDQKIAANLLPRLREWTVDYVPFPVANLHTGRRRCWLKRRSVQISSLLVKLIRELNRLLQQWPSLLLVYGLFVVNQQDLFHQCTSDSNLHNIRSFLTSYSSDPRYQR